MEVAGIFSLKDCQLSPSSKETYTARSEPANSKPAFIGSSRTTLIGASGKPFIISFQVFPKSRVLYICGFISSNLMALTAA